MQLQSKIGMKWGCALAPLILLLLAAACARPPRSVQATAPPGPGGTTGPGAAIRLEADGLTRVQAQRERQTPEWETISLLNAGAEPIKGIQFWDNGRASLLTTTGGKAKPADLYSPFALLPGEVFALSAPASADQLTGLLNWETPRDLAQLKGSISRSRRAETQADGTILLAPGKDVAWVQFELSAPLTLSGFRIAWDAEPVPQEPYLMFSQDGDTWVRVGRRPEQPRVDWMHPLDLGERVAGIRRFLIRLAYELPQTPGRMPAPEAIRIRRLRLDLEAQGPGRLRKWRMGTNEFDVTIKSPAKPELDLRLSGGK